MEDKSIYNKKKTGKKTRQKGFGWYGNLNPNAGDVEKNVEIFNNAQPDGGIGAVSPVNGNAMGEAVENNSWLEDLRDVLKSALNGKEDNTIKGLKDAYYKNYPWDEEEWGPFDPEDTSWIDATLDAIDEFDGMDAFWTDMKNTLNNSVNESLQMDNGMIEDDFYTFERDHLTYHFLHNPRRGERGKYAILVIDYGWRFDKEPYTNERGTTTIPVSRVHDKPQQIAYFEFTEESHPEIVDAMYEDDRKDYRDLIVAEAAKHIGEPHALQEAFNQSTKVYEVEKDGTPQADRWFIAYLDKKKRYQIMALSNDGEYYNNEFWKLGSGSLFSKYIYLDDLDLEGMTSKLTESNSNVGINTQVAMQLDYYKSIAESPYNKGSRREYENIDNYKEYQKEIDKNGDKNLLVYGRFSNPNEYRNYVVDKIKKNNKVTYAVPFARRYKDSDLLVHRPGTGGEILVHLEDIDIVNNISEASTTKKYSYTGPIYHFGNKIAAKSKLYTMAKSFKQARNNFIHKIANGDITTRYDIVDDFIKEVPKAILDTPAIEEKPEIVKCDNCGTQLNPMGECPVCDYGEDDLLESIYVDSNLDALSHLNRMDEIV